jgi:hypothetical protein
MTAKDGRMAYVAQGPAFIELIYCICGWALTQTCLLIIHSGFLSHVMTSLPWFAPAGLAVWRSLQFKSFNERALLARQRQGFTIFDAGWALILLILGGLLGALIVVGSASLLSIFAGALCFAPWHRVSLCRRHLTWACLVMLSGSALVLGANHKLISLMPLAVSAWVMMGSSACALLWKTRKIKEPQLDIISELRP